GSSQQAVHFAAAGVMSGQYDVAIAGGVEMMSRTPMFSANSSDTLGPLYRQRYGPDFPNQGYGAEDVADQWKLSRARLDEYALVSHARAAAARDSGAFDEQIVTIANDSGHVSTDEGIREGGT